MSAESPIPSPSSHTDKVFELMREMQPEGKPMPVTWNNLQGILRTTEDGTGRRTARILFPDILLDLRTESVPGENERISVVYKNGDSPVEHSRALTKEEEVKAGSILDNLQVIAPAASQQ